MTEHESNPLTESASAYEERLSALLAELPRETAGDDFTDAVLHRLKGRLPANDTATGWLGTARRTVRQNPWLLAAAALTLLALTIGYREWSHQQRQAEAIERIAEMRAEYLMLQQELDLLKQETSENRVVYLGEAGSTEVVLDLASLPDNQSRLEALRLLQAGLLTASGKAPENGAPDIRTADYRPEPTGSVTY